MFERFTVQLEVKIFAAIFIETHIPSTILAMSEVIYPLPYIPNISP